MRAFARGGGRPRAAERRRRRGWPSQRRRRRLRRVTPRVAPSDERSASRDPVRARGAACDRSRGVAVLRRDEQRQRAPSFFARSTVAFAASSAVTTSWCPFCAATSSGVAPSLFARSDGRVRGSSAATTSRCPFCAATSSGVAPSFFARSTVAFVDEQRRQRPRGARSAPDEQRRPPVVVARSADRGAAAKNRTTSWCPHRRERTAACARRCSPCRRSRSRRAAPSHDLVVRKVLPPRRNRRRSRSLFARSTVAFAASSAVKRRGARSATRTAGPRQHSTEPRQVDPPTGGDQRRHDLEVPVQRRGRGRRVAPPARARGVRPSPPPPRQPNCCGQKRAGSTRSPQSRVRVRRAPRRWAKALRPSSSRARPTALGWSRSTR